ncbi:MAG: hypothetical protein RJA98_2890 [Pseudomonadota bacterium]|jgi:hypothetical protein
MGISFDHVFICCEPGGPEADALLAIGLVEGTGNIHPGQGTANRRFFFEGGFIELLWVHDPGEAQSPLTAPTRLWPRWAGRHTGHCPFGLAFSPTGTDVPPPPFSTWPYRPNYLPAGKDILFAEHTPLHEPELFYLAWPHPQAAAATQAKSHPNGLRHLLSVSVGGPAGVTRSAASLAAQAAGLLHFHAADRCELRLSLAGTRAVEFDLRPTLPLVLSASAVSR